jgi:hypothetical protein
VNLTSAVLCLSLLTIAVPGLANEAPAKPHVTINVYNDAGVSEQVLAEAEQEATRIFHKAGVENVWVECRLWKPDPDRSSRCQPPVGPTLLALRIVPWSSKLRDSVFGIAFLSAEGEGTYTDVFYVSVEKLHEDFHANLSRVLGHVMAHEIGHLLLGTNAHSPVGIMRPQWEGPELRSIGMGTFLFTPEQARTMGDNLLFLKARN